MSKSELIKRFLDAARSLANQGMSKEAIMQFAKNEFGEISELFQKQIDNIFKPGQGIRSIKMKDPDFDNTVIKMQFDEEGIPFDPKNPLKYYGKPKQKNRPDVYGIRDYDTTNMSDIKKQIIKTETKLGNLNPDSPDFKEKAKVLIDELEELQTKLKDEKPRTDKYTGGIVEVEPNLSDIGHGSDALMARTRLMSPGQQATTSTGLNYLLAEDNDNMRVPFSKGKVADKARRKFMKAVGAGTAGLAALKTGLINLAEQAGPKVEAVKETVVKAPDYFFDLVSKIKMFGRQSKVGPQERVNEFSYVGKNGDEYTLTEDIVTGDARIVKDKIGGVQVGEDEVVDGIANRSVMEYKSGKGAADEGTGGALADEYDEYEVKFDYDGTEADADDMSEIIRKQIIEETSDTTTKTKKADGGRIGYSKGKVALKAGEKIKTLGSRTLAFLEKVFGKEAMAEMPRRDPEMYQGLLEVAEAFRARDKEGLIKYMRKFLPHMDDTEIEDFIKGSDGTEGIQGELIRLGSGRDYKGKLEMIKRSEEMKKLRDLEVTDDMIRKPNASGGLANLLGE